jgi:hypothetical protein
MTVSERLRAAALKVLAGDESRVAAQELESVILDEYDDLEDDRVSGLVDGLALYAPGAGSPYVDAPELRKLIAASLLALDAPSSGENPSG